MLTSQRSSSRTAGCLLLILLSYWCTEMACAAEDKAFTLDIPRQNVRAALNAMARQTGAQLLFPYDAAEARDSTAVHGTFTLARALDLLLTGTGLAGHVGQDGVITISLRHLPDDGTPTGDAEPKHLPDDPRPRVLDEVVVTSEKRAENIQRLPIAVSAFNGVELGERGIDSLETLQEAAPDLQFGFKEGSFAKISIRGVGDDLLGSDVEPAVAVIQDGVPFASQWISQVDLFDTERVEVLRGPQGTMSGRNATGGAILIQSRLPTQDFDAATQLTLGSYDRTALETYVSGPLDSNLLGRLAVRLDRAHGWVDNTLLDQRLGSVDVIQARGTLSSRLGDQVDARLTAEEFHDRSSVFFVDYGRVRSDMPTLSQYYGLPGFDPGNKTLQQDEPSDPDVERRQVTLNVDWNIAPASRLTATTGYVGSRVSLQSDLDAAAVPAIVEQPGTPLIDVTQVSQEFTFTADVGRHADVIAGLLYLTEGFRNRTIFGAPLIGVPEGGYHFDEYQRLNSWGPYTQWRYRFTDRLRLSAGIRHISDTKRRDDHNILLGVALDDGAQASWSAWAPRVALDYALREQVMVYASYSQGFESGGFDSLSAQLRTFKPETVRNYETGLKGTWLDSRLVASVAVFYMDYRDVQEPGLGIEPNSFSIEVANIPSATSKGAEAELRALPDPRVLLTFSGAYLDARVGHLLAHDTLYPELGSIGPDGLTLRDVTGNELVRAPRLQLNASTQYTQPLTASLQAEIRASYAWQDTTYFDLFNHPGTSQPAYGLANLSAAIGPLDRRWRISAFVKNLTDKFYITAKPIQPTAPVPIGVGHPGLPRTYGLTLDYRF